MAFENQRKGFKLLKYVSKITSGKMTEKESEELFKIIGEYGYTKDSIENMADSALKTMTPKQKEDLIKKATKK